MSYIDSADFTTKKESARDMFDDKGNKISFNKTTVKVTIRGANDTPIVESKTNLTLFENVPQTFILISDDVDTNTSTTTIDITNIRNIKYCTSEGCEIKSSWLNFHGFTEYNIINTISKTKSIVNTFSGNRSIPSRWSQEFEIDTHNKVYRPISKSDTIKFDIIYHSTDDQGATSSSKTVNVTINGSNDTPLLSTQVVTINYGKSTATNLAPYRDYRLIDGEYPYWSADINLQGMFTVSDYDLSDSLKFVMTDPTNDNFSHKIIIDGNKATIHLFVQQFYIDVDGEETEEDRYVAFGGNIAIKDDSKAGTPATHPDEDDEIVGSIEFRLYSLGC